MRRITIVLAVLLLGFGGQLHAQAQPLINQGNVLLVNVTYGVHSPRGDLSDRFGENFAIALQPEFITGENNFIFGLDGQYIFGTEVKEDVLFNLRTAEGFIIGNDRNPADIQLRERGFYIGANVGKLFSLSAKNPRSGLRITVGGGLLQHKIRVQDDPQRVVPQLTGEYKKGYDRLTNGLALQEFIGYQLLGRDRRLNFYAGFEFIQGFTQNRRTYNFDTMESVNEDRLDLLIGFRAGIALPFYFERSSGDIIY